MINGQTLRDIINDYMFAEPEAQRHCLEELDALEHIYRSVSICCNPPEECNDPKVLKDYMFACLCSAKNYEEIRDKQC